MKKLVLIFTIISSGYLFSQESWDFYCDNNSVINVSISDVNMDGVIDDCDYFTAFIIACPNSEILPFLLEDLEGLGCNTEINSDWVIDNNSNEDDNQNNQEWFEFICNGEPLYLYLTEEEYYDYISTLDCEEFDTDFGSTWSPVFISFNADSSEINDIWFEIYDCSGNLYLQAGAPYEGYTELPNNFNIIIVDASGDGWNEGSNIYIDGYGDFSLENGYYDTISNCDENNIDNNNDGDDNDNDWGDNMDCEEGTLISVNGGYWMDEVYWTITSCDGLETIAEGGAPYSDCISLPDNYVINMFDSWGDGWNGNIMTIGDEDNFYTIEDCSINVISVGECIIDWDEDAGECWGYWDDVIWDENDWNDMNMDNNIIGDEFDWDNDFDGFDDFNWDDFDWSFYWDDYSLDSVDWENTPWIDIIDLFINPEDLINYLDNVIFRNLFNWDDFIDYFIENNSALDLNNNLIPEKYVIKIVNLLGQNINNDYKGTIFKIYNDGTIEKKYIK